MIVYKVASLEYVHYFTSEGKAVQMALWLNDQKGHEVTVSRCEIIGLKGKRLIFALLNEENVFDEITEIKTYTEKEID